jgi:hypothetical protein
MAGYGVFMYVMYTVIVTILMLSILIAMVGESYEKAKEYSILIVIL